MTPSDARPTRRDFPFDGYTHRTLPDRRPGAGLSSSRHHLPNVPRPITAGGSSALRFQDLHAFHGLRPDTPDSAPPWSPHGVGLTPRQTSLHAADRSVAPTMWLSTLGSDAGRFPPTPPACYQAPWRLPGRDFHPLAVTSLQTPTITSSDPPSSDQSCASSGRAVGGPSCDDRVQASDDHGGSGPA